MCVDSIYDLHPGDTVTWHDPDNGICTKTITIRMIRYRDDMVQITDTDGDDLECLPEELEVCS